MKIELKDITAKELVNGYHDDGTGGWSATCPNTSTKKARWHYGATFVPSLTG